MDDIQAPALKAKVRINDVDYDMADMPEKVREQLMNLRFAESEVRRLQAQLAIAQTAKNAYQQALVAELQKQDVIPSGSA